MGREFFRNFPVRNFDFLNFFYSALLLLIASCWLTACSGGGGGGADRYDGGTHSSGLGKTVAFNFRVLMPDATAYFDVELKSMLDGTVATTGRDGLAAILFPEGSNAEVLVTSPFGNVDHIDFGRTPAGVASVAVVLQENIERSQFLVLEVDGVVLSGASSGDNSIDPVQHVETAKERRRREIEEVAIGEGPGNGPVAMPGVPEGEVLEGGSRDDDQIQADFNLGGNSGGSSSENSTDPPVVIDTSSEEIRF